MDIQCAGEIVLGMILAVQSLWDLKHREILLSVSAVGAIVGIIGCALEGRDYWEIAIALIPGGICLIFSICTKGAIGKGDAIVLFVMAFFYSLERIVSICMWAFAIAGLVAFYLLVVLHKRGNYKIPFVPFFWIGWLLEICIS